MERRTMFRGLMAVGLTGLLGVGASALDNKDTPPCCQKKDKPQAGAAKAAPKAAKTKMRCKLTGKVVDECCCEQREGKTYCPLAGKTVDGCCCEPVSAETEKR